MDPYYQKGYIMIPSVAQSSDRSWFQRHLGLPDLVVRFQYLCTDLRSYDFGPAAVAFSTEMSRICEDMRKLEFAAYQLDLQRVNTPVAYDFQVQALKHVSTVTSNRIWSVRDMMQRERQKFIRTQNEARTPVADTNLAYNSESSGDISSEVTEEYNNSPNNLMDSCLPLPFDEMQNIERVAIAGTYSSGSSDSESTMRGGFSGYGPQQQHPQLNGDCMIGKPFQYLSSVCGRNDHDQRYKPYSSGKQRNALDLTSKKETKGDSRNHPVSSSGERNFCFGISATGGCHICKMPSQYNTVIRIAQPKQNSYGAAQPDGQTGIMNFADLNGMNKIFDESNPSVRYTPSTTAVTWCNPTPLCYPYQRRPSRPSQ